MRGPMRMAALCWLAAALPLCVPSSAFAQSRALVPQPRAEQPGPEKRIALVIGNSAYDTEPLRNPINDARAMVATLKELGFEVRALENARQPQIKQAIDEFGESLRAAGRSAVGLFYYSGHGMQVAGRNWLIPVGARIKSERQVEYESVDAGRALGAMEDAGNALNIVIMDACRDNPFARSFRSAAKGLASIDAASGTLIAYATAPGRTADDGTGKNGLYTEQLIRHMKIPGLKVEDVFKRVRVEVERLSGKKQVPWESSSLKGDFYFAGKPEPKVAAAAPAKPAAPVRTLDEEEVLWKVIERSTNKQDFADYLRQYPSGRFAAAARIKIRHIEAERATSGTPSGETAGVAPRAAATADVAARAQSPSQESPKDYRALAVFPVLRQGGVGSGSPNWWVYPISRAVSGAPGLKITHSDYSFELGGSVLENSDALADSAWTGFFKKTPDELAVVKAGRGLGVDAVLMLRLADHGGPAGGEIEAYLVNLKTLRTRSVQRTYGVNLPNRNDGGDRLTQALSELLDAYLAESQDGSQRK